MKSILSKRALTLLVGEQKKNVLSQSTLSAIAAASLLKEPIHLILPTAQATDAVKVPASVKKVYVSVSDQFKNPVSADIASLVVQLCKKDKYDHVVLPHSTIGRDVAPRVAGQLGITQVSDIQSVQSKNEFTRPVYAGNALMTVQTSDPQIVVTVRTTAFALEEATSSVKAEQVKLESKQKHTQFVKEELSSGDRPELGSAKVVIAGGRGMKSGDNFKLLYALADKLGGAAVGASRAAVDSGFVPNDLQIGQTGKLVAPKLYIAVGISGAIQHLAGMKDSKFIVAINKDADAPIFGVADYGLVADLFTAIPELTEKL